MPKPLLLATEKGYSALSGVKPVDITSWGDIKKVVRQLKNPAAKEMYSTIIIDTIDIAADLCQKYICSQLGIEFIGDSEWTNHGWSRYKSEFENAFRTVTQLGYAVVFISHEKEKMMKRPNGTEYTQINPSLQSSANAIVENMADLYLYIHLQQDGDGHDKRVISCRNEDNTIRCGGRFKYIQPEIELGYEALLEALNKAIDKEEEVNGADAVTSERESIPTEKTFDYEALKAEFNTLANELMANNPTFFKPRITQVIDKYLGKGKKVMEASIDQAEFISLINDEIKEDLISQIK